MLPIVWKSVFEANWGVKEFRTVRAELLGCARLQFGVTTEGDALAVEIGRQTAHQDTATVCVKPLQAEALYWNQHLSVVIKAIHRLRVMATDAGSRATSVETRIREMGTETVGLHGLTEDLT